MNEIVKRASTGLGLISREDLAKSLNNAAMSMPTVGGDKAFLKMDKKNGDWLFGQDEVVVEKDSLWAVNPTSIKQGWVAWDTEAGGAPLQEVMVPINRALPPVDSLPPLPMSTPDKRGVTYQLQYQEQRSVDLTCVSGEDEGITVEYKQSSTGAMKLFGKLVNALLDQVQKGDEIVPVGHLAFETYEHKKYGTTFNPLFNITEWRTMEDDSPPVAEPKPAAEPAPRTRAAAPAATAPANEAPADDDEAALAAEYAAAQAATAANPVPRRRVRR